MKPRGDHQPSADSGTSAAARDPSGAAGEGDGEQQQHAGNHEPQHARPLALFAQFLLRRHPTRTGPAPARLRARHEADARLTSMVWPVADAPRVLRGRSRRAACRTRRRAARRSRGASSRSGRHELQPVARHGVAERLAQDLLAAEEAGEAEAERAAQQLGYTAGSVVRRRRFATRNSASARCASSASRSRHSMLFPTLWGARADKVGPVLQDRCWWTT